MSSGAKTLTAQPDHDATGDHWRSTVHRACIVRRVAIRTHGIDLQPSHRRAVFAPL
jgi:hypothetical protein